MTTMTPFVMFQGGCGQSALDFWTAAVPDSRIESLELFGAEGPGPEGTIKRAVALIAGQRLMVHDSFIDHAFDFTPSHSFFVACEDEAQFERLYGLLVENGQELMPAGDYGWSRRFGWVNDRFGVSWQLELA